jgi:hypothetical protein
MDSISLHQELNLEGSNFSNSEHCEGYQSMKTLKSFFLIVCLSAFSGTALSQLVTARFGTSFYAWDKFDTVGASKLITRGFQTLQLDVAEGDVSLHTYLTGAINSFGEDGTVRFSSLFLKWRNIGKAFDLNVGRVPFFAGAGNGVVDGALMKARVLDEKVTLVAYGGANVAGYLPTNTLDYLEKNLLLGGQITSTIMENTRVGVSYVNRHIKRESYWAVRPDSQFNPTPYFVEPDSRAQQTVGVDVSYDKTKRYSAYGRYDYDMNTKRSLRGQISARAYTTEKLVFTGDFIYREPFVPYNSFFTVFPMNSIREYEGGIEYLFSTSLQAFGRFAYVSYTDDNSRRLTIGANARYASVSYSGSNGYAGRLSSYYVQGMYPLFDRMFIPTVGFSYATYRLNAGVQKREESFAGSFGAVIRSLHSISLDMQVQWLRNKVANNDVRLFGKLSYWFSHDLNLFKHKEVSE